MSIGTGLALTMNTFHGFLLISNSFDGSCGRYTRKLREKMNLVARFTKEFGISFSSAYSMGYGGCSLSNVEG